MRALHPGQPWPPTRTDRLFRMLIWSFAAGLLVLCALILWVLVSHSWPALQRFGPSFLWQTTWDPVAEQFGALPFIYGTLLTAAIALAVSVPLSLGAAIFLAELAPTWLRTPFSFVIELLAAIPSIIYGLWGLFVLVPLLKPVQAFLIEHCSWIPLFRGSPYGTGNLAAGLILAIMITPIITAISRDVILAVPRAIREAAYALGATRWETIRGPVLHYGRAGILGAVLLALGRALGETMAVTMVIGNSTKISASLFDPGYTMASLLANEFTEAVGETYVSVLLEIGLILFVLTIVVNALARLLLWKVTRDAGEAMKE
ncbi:MAG: phosphate ABC transporter permease subunit PstC [Fimbriimonadaceae bacterium]|nr:phosphate ABC transporter permease subunit PstC [Fimbriimonadaceae bacterium]